MTYLNDAMTRIKAMAEEALAGSDAKDFALWQQEGFPYFTCHVVDFQPGEYYGAENSKRVYTVDVHYHAGLITQGQPGEVEQAIYTNYPTLQTFFEEHHGLESTLYPGALTLLDPQESALMPCPVVTKFAAGSNGQTEEIGAIIRLQVKFNIGISPK